MYTHMLNKSAGKKFQALVNEIDSENDDDPDRPAEPAVAAPAENSGSDAGDESGDDDNDENATTLVLGGEDVGRVSECEAWVTKKNIIVSCFFVQV